MQKLGRTLRGAWNRTDAAAGKLRPSFDQRDGMDRNRDCPGQYGSMEFFRRNRRLMAGHDVADGIRIKFSSFSRVLGKI